jgi:hypothetical protein
VWKTKTIPSNSNEIPFCIRCFFSLPSYVAVKTSLGCIICPLLFSFALHNELCKPCGKIF